MAECYRCPYTTKVERKFGSTTHCNLEITEMDVTYYCSDKHKNENNSLCPFVQELEFQKLTAQNTKRIFYL